ncbi:MAG: terminase [Deltaproteobacteria bacterium]|nr:MAG: terminase [Deltaproteobacteria bacterium]
MPRPAPAIDIAACQTVRLRSSPLFLPEKYRRRSRRQTIKFTPTAGERRLFRKKRYLPPSQWAPKNRTVTYGPLAGASWDNNFMPHLRGVLDAVVHPAVRYVANLKAPQTGSSAGAETLLAWWADMLPGPALVVYPDRETGRKRFKDYLTPVFRNSPALRNLLTGKDDDTSSLRLGLQTMLIYLGWSGSVTSLSNVSARYLVGDEIDKWDLKSSKKEANSLSLFYERFRSFTYGGKCLLLSTPSDESGPIWQFWLQQAEARFVYYIPCPDCGKFHPLAEKNIIFGECRDPQEMERQGLARYLFPCCGTLTDNRGRIKALRQGEWRHYLGPVDLREEAAAESSPGKNLQQVLDGESPSKIAFHSPALISPLVSISEIAASKMRATKDPEAAHYHDNQMRAVAHTPFRQNRRIDTVLSRRDDRPEGLVPGGGVVAALLAGVDTQDNSFVFSIRAFGWGMIQPSWGVRYGEVDSLAALEKVLFETEYRDADGLFYPVLLSVIDSGGHRTTEVYDFARQHPQQVAAYKGASGRKASPYSKKIIDRYPGTRTPIPGGVELYICDSHHYKDHLAGKMRIKPDDPGAFLFHADTDEGYATQLCAEYVDDRRLWQCPAGRANHFWDCLVMEQVAADLLGLKWLSNIKE